MLKMAPLWKKQTCFSITAFHNVLLLKLQSISSFGINSLFTLLTDFVLLFASLFCNNLFSVCIYILTLQRLDLKTKKDRSKMIFQKRACLDKYTEMLVCSYKFQDCILKDKKKTVSLVVPHLDKIYCFIGSVSPR